MLHTLIMPIVSAVYNVHEFGVTDAKSNVRHCIGLVWSDKYPREGSGEDSVGFEISLLFSQLTITDEYAAVVPKTDAFIRPPRDQKHQTRYY